MPGNSYRKRVIELQFTLAKGQFASGSNALTVRGLSCEVSIEKAGLPGLGTARIDVAGLSLDHINTLTTRPNNPFAFCRNKVKVFAGIEGEPLALVFSGDITFANANFSGTADVRLSIEAKTGFFAKATADGPLAITSATKVAKVIEQVGKKYGFSVSVEDVQTELKNVIVNGDPIQKIISLTEMSGATTYIDDDQIIVTRSGYPRAGEALLVDAAHGMVGYPRLDRNSVQVTSLFLPGVKIGSRVKVDSIIRQACGLWFVSKVTHRIGAFGTGSQPWFTEMVLKRMFFGVGEPSGKSAAGGTLTNDGNGF